MQSYIIQELHTIMIGKLLRQPGEPHFILTPSTTEHYSDKLTRYNYVFMIKGHNYTFNTLATNDLDAFISLKDFFETFIDFAREWIDLNNKYRNITDMFYRMSRYSEDVKQQVLSSNPEMKIIDTEIDNLFEVLSNLLNMYSNIDYNLSNYGDMIDIINLIQNINNMIENQSFEKINMLLPAE